MRQLLTFNEAISAGFLIWLGWRILQDMARFTWEWVLYRRWKRRAKG